MHQAISGTPTFIYGKMDEFDDSDGENSDLQQALRASEESYRKSHQQEASMEVDLTEDDDEVEIVVPAPAIPSIMDMIDVIDRQFEKQQPAISSSSSSSSRGSKREREDDVSDDEVVIIIDSPVRDARKSS